MRISNAITVFLKKIYHEREVILRRDGKMRYLRLSVPVQILFSALAVSIVGFALVISLYASYQSTEIAARDQIIQEGRVAYNDLIQDMRHHQTQLNQRLTDQLNESDKIETSDGDAMKALRNTLDAFMMRLEIDLEGDQLLAEQMVKSRDHLFAQVKNLNDQLSAEQQARGQMLESLKGLNALVSVESDEDDPVAMAGAVDEQVNRLDELYTLQANLTNQFHGFVKQDLYSREQVLKRTGVSLTKLLTLVGVNPAAGGDTPDKMANYDGLTGSALALFEQQQEMDFDLAKLEAMDRLLSCLPLSAPVDYYHVTSRFGQRKDPINGRPAMHAGLDLGGWPGINIYAAAAGKVVKSDRNTGYGKRIEIDHGCKITTRYGHLKQMKVKRGDEVAYRDVIGTLGSTGRSTGPHLHFEIIMNGQHIDPEPFIKAGRYVYKITKTTNQSEGHDNNGS